MAVSADGRSVYVTDANDDALSQYDVGARGGALTPKTPATVPAGDLPVGVAVNPPVRIPTDKAQCKGDGWRRVPPVQEPGDLRQLRRDRGLAPRRLGPRSPGPERVVGG